MAVTKRNVCLCTAITLCLCGGKSAGLWELFTLIVQKRFCFCWTKGAFWACSRGRCWKELKVVGKSVPRLLFREENKGVSPLCQRGKDLFVCLLKHIKMEIMFIFARRTSCLKSTASVGKFSRFTTESAGTGVFKANNKRDNMNIRKIHSQPPLQNPRHPLPNAAEGQTHTNTVEKYNKAQQKKNNAQPDCIQFATT